MDKLKGSCTLNFTAERREAYGRAEVGQLTESFVDLVMKFKEDPHHYLDQLLHFLQHPEHKYILRAIAKDIGFPSFDTLWDGALAILNALAMEEDPKIKRADFKLLQQDLENMLEALPAPAIAY